MFAIRQRTRAFLSVAALLFGFAQAPFFHVHAEELEHSHGSGLGHMHLRIANDDGEDGVHVEARTADDNALDVVWSVSSPSGHGFDFEFDSAGLASIVAPAAPATRVRVVRLHSHDPPAPKPVNPRAPPA